MSKLCIFAGTTEGRQLAERLANQPLELVICVATDYGESLLPKAENILVRSERLSSQEMETLFHDEQISCVIDATHPYAEVVTENIAAACESAGIEYLRLLRESHSEIKDAVYVSDAQAAAAYLAQTEGNILLTTGSKELAAFCELAPRIYARVLPMEESLASCHSAGIEAAHILAMQGPFSVEMNLALLKLSKASYLLTKEGGRSGGFEEKIEAARQAGVTPVIIGKPTQRDGMNYADMLQDICERFDLQLPQTVSVVGIGPGSEAALTPEGKQAIYTADCLIGAKRMLESIHSDQAVFEAIDPQKISDFIHEHREYRHVAVLMSGDTGFFSGTKKLLPLLADCDVTVLPGLSSLSYLCAKLGESYEDVHCISVHGREHDLVPDIMRYPRIFTLVGGENGMAQLCRHLTEEGLGSVKVSVGERLSYCDEKITVGKAEELAEQQFHSLSVALIENPNAKRIVTHGIADEEFQRGSASDGSIVPMTKMEVRSVALSKLQLCEDSLCWDIGAGSGSVAIEMALQTQGKVYAIERKEDAVELMKENCRRFHVDNVDILCGLAPEACETLPAPTHVFIGGSSGNMKEILDCILRKNPQARIVATAISLESIAELTSCMKEFDTAEVVQLSATRSRKAGPYHLMSAQNPIHIFTFQKGEPR